jgi:hypothetical protein
MLRFIFEHRTNGLSFVNVTDNGKDAGAFSSTRKEISAIVEAIEKTGAGQVQEIGPAVIVRHYAPSMLGLIGEEPGALPANYQRPAAAQPIEPPTMGEQAIRALLWFIAACQQRDADLTGWQFDYWEERCSFQTGDPSTSRVWTVTKLYAIDKHGTPFFACSPDEITSAQKAHVPAVSFLEAAGIEADTTTAYFE